VGVQDAFEFLSAAAPKPPSDGSRSHQVSVEIGGKQIDGWIDYEILNTMVEPADGFQLTRPFSIDAWKLCRPDAEIRVAIDGIVILHGYLDDRARDAKEGTMEIAGRDKSGRLVQTSIPNVVGWDGLKLDEAARRLTAPWYTTITLSNARNRSVARGRGHKAAAGSEPAFFAIKGKLDEEHAGRIDPGETRWNVLEQLCSSVGLLCWSSADGREIVIGQPNYAQAIQYMFRHSFKRGSTVKNMRLRESVRDSYSLIEVHGSGEGDDADFGDNVTTFVGIAKDGPNADGTGNRFLREKRLVMSQRAQASNAEAQRAADREMKRRNFHARQLTVEAPLHGQVVAGKIATLFAPDTMARCIDDDLEMDESWLVYACSFRGSRGDGETTNVMLVPRGTAFVS
jgi:prophage tail gpP-like protein